VVQSLNLALIVGAQHDGVLGWVQLQADNILKFFGELRVATELEGSRQMRLQPVCAQIRSMLASPMPMAAAIVRVLQYAALAASDAASFPLLVSRGRP
jgi:hypothetical protein